MIRAFAYDPDAWFVLFHSFLTLRDLSRLHQTCRTIRGWIATPTRLVATSTFRCVIAARHVENLVRLCRWAPQYIDSISVNLRPRHAPVSSPVELPVRDVVSLLIHLPRLVALGLRICSADGTVDDMNYLVACLPRLKRLHLMVMGVKPPLAPPNVIVGNLRSPPSFIEAAFSQLAGLQQLESFRVEHAEEDASAFDFSTLHTLPRLTEFALTRCTDHTTPILGNTDFACTPEQCTQLGLCRSLTRLDCGRWSGRLSRYDIPADQRPLHVSAREYYDAVLYLGSVLSAKMLTNGASCDEVLNFLPPVPHAGLNALLRQRIALMNVQVINTQLREPVVEVRPLREINLQSTIMTSHVWHFIGRTRTLRTIAPCEWSYDITSEQWAMLAHFAELRTFVLRQPKPGITIHPAYGQFELPRIRSDDVLPHLLRCHQLTELSLFHLALSVAQLTALVTQLPQLRLLELHGCVVETLAPLAAATQLTGLALDGVVEWREGAAAPSNSPAEPTISTPEKAVGELEGALALSTIRASIPHIPSLRTLHILDRDPLTAACAAPLNEALMRRLPQLTAAHFVQNLL